MSMSLDPLGLDPDAGAPLSPEVVDAIRRGESSMPDVDAAEALVDGIASLMISVATDGPKIKVVDADYKREHRALAAVLRRLGIDYPNKLDDLWRWHGRWSDGSLPTYASRRAFITDLFSPVRQRLMERADAAHELAEGVMESPTGWAAIDQQVARLRRLWRESEDADAYNGVGLQCVKVLTTLGHVVFDPARDLGEEEEEPGRDDAKERIGFFLRRVASGKHNENIRKLVNGAYGQANAAKHRHMATRTDAGIAANATVVIVSTLRLLSDEDQANRPPRWEGDIPF